MSADPWFIPDWPAPPNVHAVCSMRGADAQAGASRGAYGFFNLGQHVEDGEEAVAANRRRFSDALGMEPVFMQQVHGMTAISLDAVGADTPRADAAATTLTGRACAIMVADCLPVLLATEDGRCVAAAHAGWRGLSGGVVESALARMADLWDRRGFAPSFATEHCQAWLGPCIGPGAFEVGDEVKRAFVDEDPGAAACFRPGDRAGKSFADLPALARRRLRHAGVDRVYGNDSSRAWCTVSNPERFYSYRHASQTGTPTGRMAACIWRT